MSDPCQQAVVIAEIKTTMTHVVKLLDNHEEREDRMLIAMETIAAQQETIKANSQNIHRHEKALTEIFTILREDKKENIAQRFWNSSAGVYGLAAIALGLGIDCIAHWQLVKAAWMFFKQ